MTYYQKAFLLRLIDRTIDRLIAKAAKELADYGADMNNPQAWDAFWQGNPKLSERFTALYAARGQIQVMEVTQ